MPFRFVMPSTDLDSPKRSWDSRRVDAHRNHRRLLDAAAATFAADGAEASLNAVARNAGVGAATLYRHFPTREALLAALLADRHRALAEHADELSAATDTEADLALMTWLGAFIGHVRTYRGLARLLRSSRTNETSTFNSSFAMVIDACGRMLDRARSERRLRADFDACDLIDLANAIAIATDENPADAKRLITLLFDGLRPPPPPPTRQRRR